MPPVKNEAKFRNGIDARAASLPITETTPIIMADKESTSGLSADETSALKAVTDSINRMAGSLTGRNLEQKIQEYTSVYGEILLGMHNRLNDLERESKSLRKEVSQQHRRLSSLQNKLSEERRSRTDRTIGLVALALSIVSLVLWLLSNLMKN